MAVSQRDLLVSIVLEKYFNKNSDEKVKFHIAVDSSSIPLLSEEGRTLAYG